jgi:hypothetical protein
LGHGERELAFKAGQNYEGGRDAAPPTLGRSIGTQVLLILADVNVLLRSCILFPAVANILNMCHLIRYTIKVIVLSLPLAACNDSTHQEAVPSTPPVATSSRINKAQSVAAAIQQPVIHGDTILVDRQAAVFIRPDTLRIEKEKKRGAEEDFYAATGDYLYYMGTAQEFLDSVKVPVIDVANEKFIKFIGVNKKSKIIIVNKIPELWSIYFFDPAKKIKQVDMTNIGEEYNDYFK